ncbi:glycine--tRNA ligase isoform X1 [Hydra vulgaris]|uniref:Glycine--tRNA ligase n=1 Tax=Hydra vulgaris TaxID=6087 RepID=T2MGE0_HYDVU|nr:glycine--tRNA ligase [Hydra vulgaris]
MLLLKLLVLNTKFIFKKKFKFYNSSTLHTSYQSLFIGLEKFLSTFPRSYDKFMSDLELEITQCRASVKEQGDLVKKLKSEGAQTIDIDLAVKELKARKRVLEQKELLLDPPDTFDRARCEDLLKRRFFYAPAFEIYGGVAGLYDFGPMGCAMENNLLAIWRSHFVLEEQFLEVRCTQLTPIQVLKASGHVDRFTDVMVRDIKTGDCYRADHLLEGHLENLLSNKKLSEDKRKEYTLVLSQIDNFKKDDLWNLIQKYECKAPGTNNDLHDPQDFNLMFGTSIGPGGNLAGFMRPETAQGIFLNFKRLLEYNNGRLPFGGAQIGCGFRNEIAPRAGLLRVREFIMAEIEYFVDPEEKEITKFKDVQDTVCVLYPRDVQMAGEPALKMTLKEALEKGIIFNTAMGYFLARIQSFMLKIGVDPTKMRFRQHMANEMAHYACDCWDCELKTSYGWVECVGCADRACFDLQQHTNASGEKLVAMVDLATPVSVDVVEVCLEKSAVGKSFKNEAKAVTEYVAKMTVDEIEKLELSIKENGLFSINVNDKEYVLKKEMVKEVRRFKKDIHVREVSPHVVEPSFGIGRIMYAVLEQNFRVREGDEQRTWLSLPPLLAPVKCSVLPLSKNEAFDPFVKKISAMLTELDVSHKVDDSSISIGRRYARTDEIAIPYGVTVDFDTINKEPNTVTLRERNTTKQIRVEVNFVGELVRDLVKGKRVWDDVVEEFGLFEGQQTITK